MTIINNLKVSSLVKERYSLTDLQKIFHILSENNSLYFPAFDNGLFSAAAVKDSTQYTGYQAVWVRDNIHVAHAHYLLGTDVEKQIAVKTVKCLATYFYQEKAAFKQIIDSNSAPQSQMDRPHIRFNGRSLEKIAQEWNHAQNDALGYFLWLYSKLVYDKLLEPTPKDGEILTLFPLYFEAIQYWQDEDSGHWEEPPKIEASSIGAVIAGLKAMRVLLIEKSDFTRYLTSYKDKTVTVNLLDKLIAKGETALNNILPWESIQPGKERRYDSALLFLIYPLQVVTQEQTNQILDDVIQNLQGEYGIARYQGDSFWCKDYQDIPESIRTTISSEREAWLSERGRALQEGEEAQWCIFDPIISAIYGLRYQKSGDPKFLEQQTKYFNSSLGQLTAQDFYLGGFKCPELYYLQHGKYVPNDSTPLLWTQANLLVALKLMNKSLRNSNI
ncbi:MAG: glycoside hydrolase family 15 protein [Xenococcus sp. (in: cyanobacteria)]